MDGTIEGVKDTTRVETVYRSILDEILTAVPGVVPQVRMLTVLDGTAGALPDPTLRGDRMSDDGYLIGDTTASTGAATIRVENTAGGPFQLQLLELRPDATQHEYDRWELASLDAGHTDWSTAPLVTYRSFIAGAPQQTVAVDLAGGDLRVYAPKSFDEGTAWSLWVNVG